MMKTARKEMSGWPSISYLALGAPLQGRSPHRPQSIGPVSLMLMILLLLASPAAAQSTVLLWAPSPQETSVGTIPLTAFSSAPKVCFYAGTTSLGCSLPLPMVGTVPDPVRVLVTGAQQFGLWWTPAKPQTVTVWAYACASLKACTGRLAASASYLVHVAPTISPAAASKAKSLKPNAQGLKLQPPAGGFSPLEP